MSCKVGGRGLGDQTCGGSVSCKVGGGEVSETRRVEGPYPVRWEAEVSETRRVEGPCPVRWEGERSRRPDVWRVRVL